MWNLKTDTNEFIYKTDSQKKQTMVTKGEGGDKLKQVHSTIYKIDKQGFTLEHKELYSLPCGGFFVFFFFKATPMAYGRSQAGGRTGAAAASLHHSSWQHRILNPLSEARDQTHILMDTNQVHYR